MSGDTDKEDKLRLAKIRNDITMAKFNDTLTSIAMSSIISKPSDFFHFENCYEIGLLSINTYWFL